MDAGSTLREFDARFLYGNCELFIDSCVIGQMLVVYLIGWDMINCADMYIQTRIFRFLFDQVWVVNSEPQPDTWVVNLNSWVVNYLHIKLD